MRFNNQSISCQRDIPPVAVPPPLSRFWNKRITASGSPSRRSMPCNAYHSPGLYTSLPSRCVIAVSSSSNDVRKARSYFLSSYLSLLESTIAFLLSQRISHISSLNQRSYACSSGHRTKPLLLAPERACREPVDHC